MVERSEAQAKWLIGGFYARGAGGPLRNRFHVIAVSEDFTGTLVTFTSAGWLLPWIDVDQRDDLPRLLHDTLSRHVAEHTLVHTAVICPALTDDTRHWSCVAVVAGQVCTSDVTLADHEALLSTPSLIGRQRRAWFDAVQRLRAPVATFDSPVQVKAALDWVERQTAERLGARVLSVATHRCGRYEYVLRCQTTADTVYFKGGPEKIADEATQTELLWSVSPRHVPETLAIDRIDHRWLYRELPGEPLVGDRLTVDAAAEAVRTLASIQKRARAVASLREHLASRRLMNATGLFTRADRIVQDASRAAGTGFANIDRAIAEWNTHRDIMRGICAMVDELDLPLTLVLSDFVPDNVLLTAHGIGFIDVGNSYWSYPFIALSRFVKLVDRRLDTNGRARARILDAFMEEWADVVPRARMASALTHLAFLNRLMAIPFTSRALDLEEQSLGDRLPHWYRARELAGFALGCVSEHSPSAAPTTG